MERGTALADGPRVARWKRRDPIQKLRRRCLQDCPGAIHEMIGRAAGPDGPRLGRRDDGDAAEILTGHGCELAPRAILIAEDDAGRPTGDHGAADGPTRAVRSERHT